MPDRKYENKEDAVVDLVDDPVVPRTDAPLPVAADKFLCTGWTRLVREKFHRGLYAPSCRAVELAKLPRRTRAELDPLLPDIPSVQP